MIVHYSPLCCETDVAFDTTHKAEAIAESLRRRPIAGVEIFEPRSATLDEIEAVHSHDHVRAVVEGEPWSLATSSGLPGEWDDHLATAVLASTGGMRDAALVALRDRAHSCSLSSGLHHARRDRGSRYCTFNGLVVAARAAVAAGAQRVLVLPRRALRRWNGLAHHPTSTRSNKSTCRSSSSTRTSRVRTHDRGVVRANEYLATIRDELADIAEPGAIDLVIYNAGMDPHEDAGGVSGIDTVMLAEREDLVFSWLADHDLPCAFAMAGGYDGGVDIDGLVDLHRLTIERAAEAG